MTPLVIHEIPALGESHNPEIILSLVLPTYNEKNNIAGIIRQICQILDKKLGSKYELIIVDDDSPDLTWSIAQSLEKQYPQLRVIRRQNERGLATAVIRGWQLGKGEILGVMDADLQHPPEILDKLLDALNTSDLAVASRNAQGGGVSDWSFKRRVISRVAQLIGLIILPKVVAQVSDPMSGFFLVKRKLIAERLLDPIGYKILIEVLAKGNKGKVAEVGYVFKERAMDTSKATLKIYKEYLIHLLKLRFSKNT